MTLVVSWCAVLSLATAEAMRGQGLPEKFTAYAINLGAAVTPGPVPRPGAASTVQITINRWSTPEERDKLVSALLKGGDQALLAALQAAPVVGTIRTPDSLPWALHYAHQTIAPDGSRHIFLATDRLIHWWEEIYRTHSVSYPFMLIELQVDKAGNGEGKLLVAGKVVAKPAERRIEIESFSTEAVSLEKVHKEK
ncbi:MAG TPA: hypothetical protein VE075_09700 [Thermoanaerobaculia bacterium]|nr:hypothetical protein [Thermoanaerobaculia bacterium]